MLVNGGQRTKSFRAGFLNVQLSKLISPYIKFRKCTMDSELSKIAIINQY